MTTPPPDGAARVDALSDRARGEGLAGIATLREALSLAEALGDPARARDLRFRLIAGLREVGDLGASEDLLAVAARATPDDPELGLAEGRLRLLRGDGAGAAARLRAGLDRPDVPDRLRARMRQALGDAESSAGRPEAALEAYRAVIAVGHRHLAADAWLGVGEAAGALGRAEESAAAYRQLLGVGGLHEAAARIQLAVLAIERRDPAAARSELTACAPTGHAVLEVLRGLAGAACAALEADAASFAAAFRPYAAGGGLPPVPAVVRLARAIARAAHGRTGPWRAHAVRARRLSLAVSTALARPREADDDRRALRRLADGGAPVPLGPFLLGERLGRGAFGQVRRASHDSGVEVAVKLLVTSHGETAVAQLENELRAMAALDHPRVVRLLHHDRVDAAAATMDPELEAGTPWIATELATGGTIEPLLGRLPWADVRRVLLGILDALAHAHARGLLHLDVKPANVLVVREPLDVRLADFGLAAAIAGAARPLAGTPHYMAPEQFRGVRELGPWTDLYALGCLAVALVSGAPPFGGTTLDALRSGHLGGQPELRPRIAVPPGCLPWIRRLLVKSPGERFRRAADAARALAAIGDADGLPMGGATASEELLTVVLPPVDDREAPTVALEGALCEVPPPEVPPDWRTRAARAPARLTEAGLGLFGLRVPAIVGREAERDALWAALRDVSEQRRALAVRLVGAPGAGTSALLGWLGERAHEVGAADVIRVRPEPGDRPGAALLRGLARFWGATSLEDVEDRQAFLAARLAADGRVPAGELRVLAQALGGRLALPAHARRSLLARALLRATRRRPIVLAIDDAARDPDTLALVAGLLGQPTPLLAVFAARPGELAPLDAETRCRTVEIVPLDAATHRALVAGLLPFDPATEDAICAATAGSPRAAVQVTTDLVRRQRLVPTAEGWALRPGEPVPASLGALWRARLEAALSAEDARARLGIEVAALLGPTVPDRVWAAACAAADATASRTAVASLVSARLAEPRDEGFAFADEALVEVLRADSAVCGREHRLRRACAAACAAAGDAVGEAGHHERCGAVVDAVRAWVMAAENAVGHSAPEAALRDLERASALLPAVPPEEAASLACLVAWTRGRVPDHPDAERDLRAALALAGSEGWPDHRTILADLSLHLRNTGQAPLRIELQAALAGAEARSRARCLVELAGTDADPAVAEARLREALQCIGDHPAIVAQIRRNLGRACVVRGRHDEAIACFEAAEGYYAGAGRPSSCAGTVLDRGNALRAAGRTAEAERAYATARETMTALGDPEALVATANLAVLAWSCGRDAEGDALAEEALDLGEPRASTLAAIAALMRLVERAASAGPECEALLEAAPWTRLGAGLANEVAVCLDAAARRAERVGLGARAARIRERTAGGRRSPA